MTGDVLKKPLSKTLELDLVETLYRKQLDESSWTFWRILKHVRDEHAAIAMKVLEGNDESEAELVRAAWAADGAEGLRAAGAFYAWAGSSTNLPGLFKRLKKDAAKFDALVPVMKKAIAALLPGDEPDTLTFWPMVWLVAHANPKDPLLAKLRKANDRWGDEYDTLNRVLASAS